MPDWKVGEFEGKFKDEFTESNKNGQEDGAGPLNISNKKLKHEITSEKNPQGVVSAANNSDLQKCNSEHIQGINSADGHVRGCKTELSDFPLSTEDTISETRYQAENWNNCQFTPSNGSAVLNNHSVPQSDLNYGDNDLNFIDWPSIDNFEDVDTLFRCDSTYGEQQLENTDEMSWIPSSDAIYSSDIALQAGFDSSYSDYGVLGDLSEFHCAQDKTLPTADEQFNDNYPFNEQKNVNVYGEQTYQGDAMEEFLSTDQICNGDGNIDMAVPGDLEDVLPLLLVCIEHLKTVKFFVVQLAALVESGQGWHNGARRSPIAATADLAEVAQQELDGAAARGARGDSREGVRLQHYARSKSSSTGMRGARARGWDGGDVARRERPGAVGGERVVNCDGLRVNCYVFQGIGERYSSENTMQQLEDRKFSISSGSQLSSSQNLLKQKLHSDSTSPSNITSECYPDRNCQFSPSGTFVQRNLMVQQPGQPINDEQLGQQTSTRRASYSCENYEVEKKGLGKRSMGDRQVTLGKSVVVDGSFVSSLTSDNSVEESSFRQLQDAVSQLDVKTKLCIRDGLYRLARSAQNRPVFSSAMSSHGDSQDVKDMQNTDTSGKFVDPRSSETQTNPVDRSIALLLFHQPSDQMAGAVCDPCQ